MNYRYAAVSVVALLVALAFLLIGDGTDRGAGTSGAEYIVMRYFHSVTWLLLAVYFLLWSKSVPWRDYVGYSALAVYVVFLLVTFM